MRHGELLDVVALGLAARRQRRSARRSRSHWTTNGRSSGPRPVRRRQQADLHEQPPGPKAARSIVFFIMVFLPSCCWPCRPYRRRSEAHRRRRTGFFGNQTSGVSSRRPGTSWCLWSKRTAISLPMSTGFEKHGDVAPGLFRVADRKRERRRRRPAPFAVLAERQNARDAGRPPRPRPVASGRVRERIVG